MTETSQELQDSIRLALEAAEAANDAADEIDAMQQATEKAAHRIDRFGATVKPLMIGTLLGSVIVIGLGGLVYFRTLSEMRTATATQLEALTMFASRVEALDARIAEAEGLGTKLDEMQVAQTEALTALGARLDGMGLNFAEEITTYSEAAGSLSDEIAGTLTKTVEQNHVKTRDAMMAGLSDLQLAMSRLMADVVSQPAAVSAAPKPTASAPKPVKPQTVKPAVRAKKPAPAPKPNPFSYP